MSKVNFKEKMQITTFDALLGSINTGEITEVPISDLHEFDHHPFYVVDDEKMDELVESIRKEGLLSPAIVRKRKNGGYEIISGHRRKRACELAGFKTMPVIIRELDDDEATILMVDANIQRENILPSERAFSLQMKMNALKNQGKRTDLTSGQVGPKLAAEEVGDEEGISARQIKRYVRLTNLLPELLERVDSGSIGFVPAVELSFIGKPEQEWIVSVLSETNHKVSLKQANELRDEFEQKKLDEASVVRILTGKKASRTVSFSEKELKKIFPKDMDAGEIKEIIIGLLEKWKEESSHV